MTRSDVVARRYAEAYFVLAQEAGDVQGWRDQLARAVAVLRTTEVAVALSHPALGLRRRAELAMALLEDAPPAVRNLVRLLVEHGRAGLAAAVLEHVDRLCDRASGVVRTEVVSAVPLDDDLRGRVEATLRERLGGRIETVLRTDPAILGGLIVRIGDRVIDASLRTRLQRLQAALAQ